MTHYSDQNKLDKIVKEATSNSDDTEKALTAILNKLALEDFTLFDKCTIDEKNCNCESCNGKRCLAAYSLEELKAIQTYWLELRQYIRIVYRLSMKGSLKNIDNEYRDYMKDIVSRLCDACDPHQLYIKLEAQVKEFVIEIKVRLLQLMDRLAENPQLPRLFISGLLDRYNKMMNAAHEITPVLIQLEAQHLVKFNLTWKILNQRLFQTNIYSDLFFQNSVPLFITQLGKARDSEDNKKMVRDFLRFDDEISHVEEIWGDIEARIRQYILTEVTSVPKESTRGDGSKIAGSPLFPHNCECHVCIEEVPPDHVGEIDEIIPLSPKTASFHLLSHIHGNREESVLSVYPPVFESTGLPTDHDPQHEMWCRDNLPTREGITKEMLEHHSCQLSKSGKKSVDKSAQKALEINGLCKEFERLEENRKAGSGGKGKTEGHNLHCSKHTEAMRRMHAFEDGFLDTDSNDSGPTDPRHCDCCYCEVFGHGMPPTAPMSKNYQEMRERLRLLLNKKKLKCKSSSVNTTPQATQKKPTPTSNVANSSNTAQDTRALEDLLDFIEGNEVKCRDEKKAAKKARQKEKKRIQLTRKKMEEEELAKKIRLREEELKRKALEEEAKRKRREEANAAALKAASSDKQKAFVKLKKKSKSISNVTKSPQPPTQHSGMLNPMMEKPCPQMVTIKRVMEPHNSEPTVTITLRGATPNQDRVLYTLLNGQVCKVKDMPQERVSVSTKETQTKGNGKIPTKSKPCGNNAPKNPACVPTRVKELPSKITTPKNEPVKFKPHIPTKVVTPKTNKDVLSAPSVQMNNGVNISKSSSSTSSFNIADIKLPPGITITKVDPSNVQPRNTKIQEHSVKKVVTNSKQDVRCSSEVIVVSTSKKEPQEIKGSLPEPDSLGSKKKRNRKKNNSQMLTNGKTTGYPGLEIEPISLLEKEDVSNHMSVLTISPYQDQENASEQQWVSDNGKKKKKKTKKSPISNLINPEEWQLLESVFAPKDIDLDDGEMDDAERELEAFKRFCLQSIPPKRKEKVHLNIKDIVLKKKSSPYN